MKKIIRKSGVLFLVLIMLMLVSCTEQGNTVDDTNAEVIVLQDSITLKDIEVEEHDFTKYFKITVDGVEVEVLASYIDAKTVTTEVGTYEVKCSYGKKYGVISVTVVATSYEVTLAVEEVTLRLAQVDEYDFKSLFKVMVDGVEIEITKEMITSDVQKVLGTYQYTVAYHGVSKTLTVHIKNDNEIEIIKNYQNKTIAIDELESFDFTELFNVYLDGVAVQVTNSMIDKSSIATPVVGQEYQIKITFQSGNSQASEQTIVTVVQADEIAVSGKSIVIYPNSEYVELTSLFEITKGNEIVEVTSDMITGSIDYSTIGSNTITLNYKGHVATATVEIKLGVIIDYRTSDTIVIIKGTDQNSYSFANDFKVLINGLIFENIPDSYLNFSEVDFSKEGNYQASIRIPYNDKTLGITNVNFTYFEQTINYVVIENTYSIDVKEEVLELPVGTTTYNVYNNLNVLINGRKQTLTNNPDYVDLITCYAKVLSNPLDFSLVGEQEVKIAVYANGVDKDPIEVSYFVIVESSYEIEAQSQVIFCGETIYTRDLFKITDGTTEIEVTNDMITGGVNSFVPGIYYVTINYLNIIKTAEVVVLNGQLKGVYHTTLTTIAKTDDDEYGSEEYNVNCLGDLVINSANDIVVNGVKAKEIIGLDENTLQLKLGSNTYNMYYDNGIVVLNPDNSIKLGFSDYKRPMIYFNEKMWDIEQMITINNSSDHVLSLNTISYTIDTFEIKSKVNSTKMWYGLKIYLFEKNSADTVYDVTWGEVKYASDFTPVEGLTSSLTFKNEIYSFTMTSNTVGKINNANNNGPYAGMTFTGTIDGKEAKLIITASNGISLVINSKTVCSFSVNDVEGLKNGGFFPETNTIIIYKYLEEVFSYKFIVNPETKTFEYVEKDSAFGKYIYSNKFIFIDGYGTGLVNFNTKSYYTTEFSYTANGSDLILKYLNIKSTFEYGESMIVSMDNFGNVITVRKTEHPELVGAKLENCVIIDGAIVHISNYVIGQNSDAVARKELYSNIEIITKDGVMSDDDKAKLIDTSKVRFNTPGFYQFTIKIDVNGQEVTNHYAVQILEAKYSTSKLVATYGSGIIFDNNSLLIDKYGRVTLLCGSVEYTGMSKIVNDTFTATVQTKTGLVTNMSGYLVKDGIIFVRCVGGASYTDYYTVGQTTVTGIDGLVLRSIDVNGTKSYFVSNSLTIFGEETEVELISGTNISSNGSIIKFSDKTLVKVVDWGNSKSGLELSDGYHGTYTCSKTGETIMVNGFGKVTINDIRSDYVLTNNVITVTINNLTKVYRLNKETMTCEEVNVDFDESLVSGKSFTATHIFYCESYRYNAVTTFKFLTNNQVVVQSTSSEHDEGDYACGDDYYNPTFASSSGVAGKYSVSGNEVTVTVGGETFVFTIYDLVNVSEIVCQSTTVGSDEHGYFAEGTKFVK